MKVLVIDVDEHDRVKLSRKRLMKSSALPDEMASQGAPAEVVAKAARRRWR